MKLVTFILTTFISQAFSSKVVPINYDVRIKLEPDAFFTDTFYGQVNISVEILEETRKIPIHAKDVSNIFFRLMDQIGNTYKLETVATSFDDILLMQTQENLAPGLYYLTAIYYSTFSLIKFCGLYKTTYENKKGDTEILLMAQLYQTCARRVFPCFDEEIRATFDLTLTYPRDYTVLANTLEKNDAVFSKNNSVTVRFSTTPLIPMFSISFIVSNFTCDVVAEQVLCRVCSRPDFQDEREYALNMGHNLIEYMDKFTGVGSSPKIDLVAVPDFTDKHVPTWGLFTFDEATVLWNEKSSSNLDKQQVAISIAQKISQIWFGNFVNGEWWLDSFLGTYFGYFAVAEIESNWELDRQFIIERVQTALTDDSSGIFHSLSGETGRVPLSQLIYSKGASIIRMIVHVIGTENFQKGLQYYLKIHMFNSTKAEDLWNCLERFSTSTYNIKDFVENWIYGSGYPVLNVSINGTDVIITQEPVKTILLLASHSTNRDKWYVPITYATPKQQEFDTIAQAWLTPYDEQIILKNITGGSYDWIVLTSGYYRVLYDHDLLNRISLALRNNLASMNVINRAQFIDDLFNLARLGYVSYSKILDTLQFLKNDSDYYTWYAAFRGFDNIIARSTTADTKQKLTNYIRKLMAELYNSVPFYKEDIHNHIFTLKQILTFTWTCKLEDPNCVNTSLKIFADYKKGLEVPKNLKPVIFCTSLRHSNYIESDWLFLWNKFEEAEPFEQITFLEALTCVSKKTILNRYIYLVFDSRSQVRQQDVTKVLSAIIKNSPVGINVVLEYLVHNYERLQNDSSTITSIIYFLGNAITDQSQLSYLSKLAKNENMTEEIKVFTGRVLELAVKNLNYQKNLENELGQYFSEKITIPVTSTEVSTVTVASSFGIINVTDPTANTSTVPSSSGKTGRSCYIILCSFVISLLFL